MVSCYFGGIKLAEPVIAIIQIPIESVKSKVYFKNKKINVL